MTKASLLIPSILLVVAPLAAERGDDTDRVSKNGRLETSVGDVRIVVEYGRPNVKGREIWSGLVPYGEVWRTGADEATTFESTGDLLVAGEPLPAGRYGLFTIPRDGAWTVIFNATADQWGAFNYEAGEDVLRVEATPGTTAPVEEMEFVATDSGIALRWAQLELPIALAAP